MTRKKTSVRDWVSRKNPDFDPKRHSVFVNGELADDKKLDGVLLPFDHIDIKEKRRA